MLMPAGLADLGRAAADHFVAGVPEAESVTPSLEIEVAMVKLAYQQLSGSTYIRLRTGKYNMCRVSWTLTYTTSLL